MREIRGFDECVSDDVSLVLRTKEEQVFSQVVNESGNLYSFQLSVSSDGLGGLKQVSNLRNARLEE